MTYALLVLFGVVSGVTTVLFGFGGGFVTVPLIYRLIVAEYGSRSAPGQAAMHIAVATSTGVMVVSSLLATWRHARAVNVVWSAVWPLAAFIALGSMAGALAATHAPSGLIRWAFVAYLGLTIVDCLFRTGFMTSPVEQARVADLSGLKGAAAGLGIGSIATFLGVGGSVMTVPLMRRRGLDMTRATAMANPLTLPVAVVGSFSYALLSITPAQMTGPHLGSIDLVAFALLVLTSLVGIQLASPLVGRIPDRLHARIYVALLAVVLFSMLL